MAGTHVTPEGLRQLRAKLRTLLASRSPLSCDEGLRVIADLYRDMVEEVQAAFGGDALGCKGVAALGACSRLRVLDVNNSAVGEAGLRGLLEGPAGGSLQVGGWSPGRGLLGRSQGRV